MEQLSLSIMGFGLGLLTASFVSPNLFAAIAQGEASKPASLEMQVSSKMDADTLNMLSQNIEKGNPAWRWNEAD